jgi:hypothetical protein
VRTVHDAVSAAVRMLPIALGLTAGLSKALRPGIRPGAWLTGLHPSPTRHAVVGFRFSGRLTQGPAVRAADRRHSLRLDVLTMTRSAYVQVRCAVVALWSERLPRYAQQIRPASLKLDSILPTLSDIAWLGQDAGRCGLSTASSSRTLTDAATLRDQASLSSWRPWIPR